MSQSIQLAEYDSSWPDKFEAEKQFLIKIVGQWLSGSVEHVGSTAVEGLIAKPVIDIMFGVESLEASKPAIKVLSEQGYCYYPYKADVMHWFCKPSDEYRTHHLHLIPFESPLWCERILFRDVLRKHAKVRDEYSALKKVLAESYTQDREAYTQRKWPFIQNILLQYGLKD